MEEKRIWSGDNASTYQSKGLVPIPLALKGQGRQRPKSIERYLRKRGKASDVEH